MIWSWGDVFAFARVAGSSISGAARAVLMRIERHVDDGSTDDSADEPAFGPLGFFGRPDEPSSEGECEVLVTRIADGLRPLVFRDLRISKRVNPKIGDLGVAHYGGGYVSLGWDDDRTATVVTISGTHLSGGDVDEAHFLQLDPTDAGNSVVLSHRGGQNVTLNKSGAVTLTSSDGNGTITVQDSTGPDGAQPNVVIGGSLALVGGIIAGSTDAAEPVALAAAYQAALEAALPILLAAAAAANTLAPGSVSPTQITEITARVAALVAAGKSQTLKASPV